MYNLKWNSRLPEFTHHGNWKINDEYRNDANGVTHQLVWKVEDIENQMNSFKNNTMQGGYGSGKRFCLNFNMAIREICGFIFQAMLTWLQIPWKIMQIPKGKHVLLLDLKHLGLNQCCSVWVLKKWQLLITFRLQVNTLRWNANIEKLKNWL